MSYMITLTQELPAVALNGDVIPQVISLDIAKIIKGDPGDVNPEMYTILAEANSAKDQAIAAQQAIAMDADRASLDAQAIAADRVQTGLDAA